MSEGVVLINPLQDDFKFLSLKCFDYILNNEDILTKKQILEKIRNLRDEIDRFC